MPTNLTDVDAFTSPIVAPVGGDVRVSSSVRTSFQQLANRTRNLLNLIANINTRLDDVVLTNAAVVFPADVAVTKRFHAGSFDPHAASGGEWTTHTNGANGLAAVNSGRCYLDLTPWLPPTGEIRQIQIHVTPSTGGNMSCSLVGRSYDGTSPSTVATDTTSGTGYQILTMLSPGTAVDVSVHFLWIVELQAGASGAGLSQLHSLTVVYASSQIVPNF